MTDQSTTIGPLRHLAGTAIALRGNDINTDRIMPARFLKAITFAGLEEHVFANERRALRERGNLHPFDDPRHRGGRILLVNRNFGCGSSREHAPQALHRWGIMAVVGESFGEIFAGNCLAVGMPCLCVTEETAMRLQDAAEADGSRLFAIDLEEKTMRSGDIVVPVALPDGARAQFLEGTWDSTPVLLAAGENIERVASRLPYLNDWV
jgi:3-isopropylmalate/(R)-2-methylmalate dehydratase small subunit